MPDLWPYPPLTPSTERLEFLTDVMRAYSAEQRPALRAFPRQQFTYVCRLTRAQTAKAAALIRANDGGEWYVPVWHELSRPGALASAATSISVDTTIADYRAGGYALVWADPDTYTVAEISSVSASSIGLSGALGADYSAPVVCPLRTAYLLSVPSLSAQIPIGDIQLDFEVTDNKFLGSQPYDTYDSAPVLISPPLHESGVQSSLGRRQYMVDNSTGPVARIDVRSYTENVTQMTWRDQGQAARWDRRTFLHYIRGKQKAFWCPTWRADLTLTAAIGAAATTITVNSIGGSDVYAGRRIVIRNGSNRYYRALSFVSTSGGVDTLSIGSALGASIPTSALVSFLNKSRLDTDKIEMAHHLEGYTDTGVTVREVPA